MTQMLVAYLLLFLCYHSGQLIWMIIWKSHEKHYLIGFKPGLFQVKVFDIKFSIGFYIPLPFLSKMTCLKNGKEYKIPHAWEYFELPIAKRMITAFGGTLALFFAAIIMNIGVAYFHNEIFIPKEEVDKYGIYPTAFGEMVGFKSGDKILSINGKEPENYNDLIHLKSTEFEKTVYSVLRENERLEVTIPKYTNQREYNLRETLFAGVLFPFEISKVIQGSGAEASGLKAKDKILTVNYIPVTNLHDFKREFSKITADFAMLKIGRSEDNQIFEAKVSLDNEKELGLLFNEIVSYTTKENTLLESISQGVLKTFKLFSSNINVLYNIVAENTVTTSRPVGPIGIAELFSDDSLLNTRFWMVMSALALFSVTYNLLPLPKSAIMQIIPLSYEAITGSRFSVITYNRLIKAQYFILAALMAIILFYDIIVLLVN